MDARITKLDVEKFSSLRCGGTLNRVVMPKSVEEIIDFCQYFCGEEKVVIGGLSNTLVLSGGVDKLCLFTKQLMGITIDNEVLEVSSGESLVKIAQVAQSNCLSGLEPLCGIPGTVGGAVFGNSGSFNGEIGELVESIKLVDLSNGQIEELSREEIGFLYRKTVLRKGKDMIYSIKLRLLPDSGNEIALRMARIRAMRKKSQPGNPSLGCVFKKCEGISAGYYIEKAGLKGYEENRMQFSPIHANFIINKGGTPEDYLTLVELAEKAVYEKLGKKLVREVNIIGEPSNKEFNSRGTAFSGD